MARNLFTEKKGGDGKIDDQMFDEYVKESDKISKKRNESELQKYIKSFLKAELKSIVDNFVKMNKVNDPHLKEKANTFFEIFHIKFTKLFSVIFKLNKQKFLELIRVSSKTNFEANKLWGDVSTKYEYFKTHGVLNSDILKNFVRMFLSNLLIQKEIQFFMMYHFDMIHDFDTSKLMNQIENYVSQPVLQDTSSESPFKQSENAHSKNITNVFLSKDHPLLSDVTFDNKEISTFNLIPSVANSRLNDAIMMSGVSRDTRIDKSGMALNSNAFGRFLE